VSHLSPNQTLKNKLAPFSSHEPNTPVICLIIGVICVCLMGFGVSNDAHMSPHVGRRTGWSRVPFILPRPSGNAKVFFLRRVMLSVV
jgi:hypothetical protein